jgi:uncharacterized membrane protein
MSRRTYLALGVALVCAALIGFFTVADDLRHTGEIFAVLGILLSGAALLVAGLLPRVLSVLALHWVPACVALGAVVGTVIDNVVLGVSLGAVLGLVVARLRRSRGSSAPVPCPPA